MANVLVEEETLTAIADAVRARGGTSELMKPSEIPDAVSRIPSGSSGADMSLPIRFFDYDGTLLHSFSLEELAEMEDLPDLPSHEKLICSGWNWTLEDLKATNREMNVVALYVTDDGATRFYVVLDEDMLEPQVSFGQTFYNGVEIDWGDGSQLETAAGGGYNRITLTHQYPEPGEYVIRFLPKENNMLSFFGGYNEGSYVFTAGKKSKEENMKYLSAVRKIEIGKKVYQLDSYCFCGMSKLESIVLAETKMPPGNGIVKCCYSLKFLGIWGGWGYIPRYLCEQCSSLKNVSIPNGIDALPDYAFSECYSLESITLPDSVMSVGKYALNECLVMKEVYLSPKVKTIAGSAFRNDRMLEHIILRSGLTEIAEYMFSGCCMLTELVIPDTVTLIDKYGFENCKGMKRYYFLSIWPPNLAQVNAFYGISEDCKIYVPKGMLSAYQTADYWSNYASYMAEMDGDVP